MDIIAVREIVVIALPVLARVAMDDVDGSANKLSFPHSSLLYTFTSFHIVFSLLFE
jgi:hypothetical protein